MKLIKKGAIVALAMLCGSLTGGAQNKNRRVEQPTKFVYSNVPVEVVVDFDGKEMPGRAIQAGPDWIHRITLDVTNTSGKDINWLWINLIIREGITGISSPGPDEVGIAIPVELRHSSKKVLTAGDRVVIKPPESMVEYWTKYAGEHGLPDIERLILDVRQVGFTDDTIWTKGHMSRKDPAVGQQARLRPTLLTTMLFQPLFTAFSSTQSASTEGMVTVS